jgi:hypothetical protein
VVNDALPTTEAPWPYQPGDAGILVQRPYGGMSPWGYDEKFTYPSQSWKNQRNYTRTRWKPSLLMAHLIEAITKFTNLDLTTPVGILFLHVQFISQSAPDSWKKLQKLEQRPQTPLQGLLNTAFRVFNNRKDKAKLEKEKHLKVKYQLLASDLNPQASRPYKAPRPSPSHWVPMAPPRACSCCGNPGHWAKMCPNPRPPSKPCPTCRQWGHWKVACPQGQTPQLLVQPMEPVISPCTQLLEWGGLDSLNPTALSQPETAVHPGSWGSKGGWPPNFHLCGQLRDDLFPSHRVAWALN